MRKHVLVLTPAPAVMNARLEQMNKDSRHVRGRWKGGVESRVKFFCLIFKNTAVALKQKQFYHHSLYIRYCSMEPQSL